MALLFPVCLLCACETDSYDKGEGKYSLMQADFVELTVNSEKQGTQFLTDEGEQYRLITPVTASWIQRPDTIYRAIVYFNKTAAGEAQATAMGQMGVLRPIEHWRFKEQPQDPLGVESAAREAAGLGLIDMEVDFAEAKRTAQAAGVVTWITAEAVRPL